MYWIVNCQGFQVRYPVTVSDDKVLGTDAITLFGQLMYVY